MFCPICGTQNEEGARFCAKCGAELPRMAAPTRASHLDTNGDGIPDVLEPTTVSAPPTTVMAPPTTNGTFSSIGMNMPKAKARAGTLQRVSTMASTAPMAYNSQGAPTPFISGSMTAAMALACGAASAPEVKP